MKYVLAIMITVFMIAAWFLPPIFQVWTGFSAYILLYIPIVVMSILWVLLLSDNNLL